MVYYYKYFLHGSEKGGNYMRKENLSMLQESLEILEKGSYQVNGRTKALKLSRSEMEEAVVLLPEDEKKLFAEAIFEKKPAEGGCVFSCENMDSFAMAARITERCAADLRKDNAKPVLVLNMANPENPGGGVRRGANAQEEDLCRKSSLLLSVESENAAGYYRYNRSLNSDMGSDAIVIHPRVEVFRDEKGDLLPESFIVSVLTCAAPILFFGLQGRSQQQYEAIMYNRIETMLKAAAALGYRYLVLGAFGCGAFRNDAHVVSDLFRKAVDELDFAGMKTSDLFRRIDFAVLDRTDNQYNFMNFSRNFGSSCGDMPEKYSARMKRTVIRSVARNDVIRGCLFGGAAGDALGYPVEFMQEESIFKKYGSGGIRAYEKDRITGTALISDDTQMALFTANGLLAAETARVLQNTQARSEIYVRQAYLDWLLTQESSMAEVNRHQRCTAEGGYSWLLDVPELYSRRAPGNTCISALRRERSGEHFDNYVEAKRNNSKGCGGIMRVAALGALHQRQDIEELDMEGAQLAAITHGHSLGYMPAAVLVHIINRIVYPPDGNLMTLEDIVLEAADTAAKIFAGDPHLPELLDIISLAVSLSKDPESGDLENIHRIGEGWVAEETLGISLYCALKYSDNFSQGIIAAVNHKGDSDSTGAVTGNILGALSGYQAIAEQWKEDLELSDVILEIADDVFYSSRTHDDSDFRNAVWETKYQQMHRYE